MNDFQNAMLEAVEAKEEALKSLMEKCRRVDQNLTFTVNDDRMRSNFKIDIEEIGGELVMINTVHPNELSCYYISYERKIEFEIGGSLAMTEFVAMYGITALTYYQNKTWQLVAR